MTDGIMMTFGDDGTASLYDDTYDITIHCESQEEQDEVKRALQNIPHWIPVTEPPKSDFMPYYATCRSKVDDRENWVIEGMYTKYSGWEYPPMVRDDRAEIIAWMPKELPEPYKGVTDGDD